jgi:hypothetical protein
MRADLRKSCSDIWVIDASPEGHQPAVNTRLFQGVQQEICIVLALRRPDAKVGELARIRYRALPESHREDKFLALAALTLTDNGWQDGDAEIRGPFLPEHSLGWGAFPALSDLFESDFAGVMSCRTWVIAPDSPSLSMRWDRLVREKDLIEKAKLFHEDRDRTLARKVSVPLGIHAVREQNVETDKGAVVTPVRFGFRSLDRQWIVPDHRLLSQGRPELWANWSSRQVFGFVLDQIPTTDGPGIIFSDLIPDKNYFRGNSAGRAIPLWRDAAATVPNIKAPLLAHLSATYGKPVTASDVMAYVAALLAHPAFTARFNEDLIRPGLRVPVTADPALFDRAVTLGREVIWLHTYGERFADPASGRPAAPPRMPKGQGPTIPVGGTIPGAPNPLPDTMHHDPSTGRLHVGEGFIENVPTAVAEYQVSGRSVLRQWFSYRKADRTRPVIGDRRPPSALDKIQPDHWLPEYTEDLLNLLHVLGRLVALEPAQATLLDEICAAPLLTEASLTGAGALASAPVVKGKKAKAAAQPGLFD